MNLDSLQPGHNRALEGVRVLDLSRVLAGPLCSMMLGDLGADVIKVESFHGDDTRQWGPPWADFDARTESAYYLCANRNKRSIIVNLKHDEGSELIRRLAERSQILLENFLPGKMAEFGLDWTRLKERNPGLVYCSISGFGQTGPYRNRPGYDYVIQAMSGLMALTGPMDGDPTRIGVPISDVVSGLFAVNSVLAALRHCERTGEGQHLDVALLESQLAALVNVASGYLASRKKPKRHGNQHPNIVPYQVFHGSDRTFVVAAGNDRQFRNLCEVLERPDFAQDERFTGNPQRVAHRNELVSELSRCFASETAQHWVAELLRKGVPAGLIQEVPEALEDEQVSFRGLVQEVGGYRGLRYPVHFSETDPEIRLRPPGLGQHTREVLQEVLELNSDDIEALEGRGVIGVGEQKP